MSSWQAKAAIRAQLDELMGKERDEPLDSKKKKSHWNDDQFCKNYLVKFCPHELFKNTKSDLGPCSREHDDRMKEEFAAGADLNAKYNYSYELMKHLENLVVQLDRQIERAQDRVQSIKVNLTSEQQERVEAIAEEIKVVQVQMSDAGEEGDVQKCMELMEKMNTLKQERDSIESGEALINKLYGGEKQQSVCVICGAISQSTDNDQRLVAHLEGKQHQGYLRIRVGVEELKREIEQIRKDREAAKAALAAAAPPPPPPPSADRDRGDRDRERVERERTDRDRDSRGGSSRGGRDDRRDDRGRDRDRDSRRDSRGGYDDRRRERDRSPDRGYDDRRRERDRSPDRGGHDDRRRERDRSPDRGRDTRRERDRSPY